MQPANLSKVHVSDLSSKMRSKKEMYFFLVNDCSAYMPPLVTTNIYFFKSILRGTKDVCKAFVSDCFDF